MAYTALPSTQVDNWDGEYNDKAEDLRDEQNGGARQRLERELEELGAQIDARLTLDIGKVRGYYARHTKTVNTYLAEAQKLGKTAQSLVGKYKKDPKKTEYVAQIKLIAARLGTIDKAITDDANALGAAWFDYRSAVATHVPEKYKARFHAVRSTTMNESKILSVKQQQIVTIRREVKALLAITDKAKVKSAIKAGTGTDRPVGEAQRLATELAAREQKLLAELRDPPGLQAKPRSLETTAPILEGTVNDTKTVLTNQAMIAMRGSVANGVSAAKLMETRLAAMLKIYETTKKGLRSTELKDATVQAQLTLALKHITDAKKEVKDGQAYLKRMQAALAKLESKYKTLQRKK